MIQIAFGEQLQAAQKRGGKVIAGVEGSTVRAVGRTAADLVAGAARVRGHAQGREGLTTFLPGTRD